MENVLLIAVKDIINNTTLMNALNVWMIVLNAVSLKYVIFVKKDFIFLLITNASQSVLIKGTSLVKTLEDANYVLITAKNA
jgi:hypothetical protein